jgi:vacuolar-type H+-ATPase subunit I/STV1
VFKQAAEQKLENFKNRVKIRVLAALSRAASKEDREASTSQPSRVKSLFFEAAQKASKEAQGKQNTGFFRGIKNTDAAFSANVSEQEEIRRLQSDFSNLRTSTSAKLEQLQSAKDSSEKALNEMQMQVQQNGKQSEVQHVQVQMELEAMREDKARMSSMLEILVSRTYAHML